ncbi:MAG TPA: tRNA (5-methylaminomethyl-2-thiouridine)(34)-methyltransferase MnmD [Chitinophagaceae bacterium]|nr:tRNA (5-methylaminomethyl-2-thiouridine)(34)-methyltransferase MnmD [Chitinophagaceae bacterium]
MQREIILTRDGSHSITIPSMQVTYHSLHGAIQESMHVFIRAGLDYVLSLTPKVSGQPLNILEIGMGTGLNALLTMAETSAIPKAIRYTGIEPHPLSIEEAGKLNYCSQPGLSGHQSWFDQLHLAPWEDEIHLPGQFALVKTRAPLQMDSVFLHQPFDLVYFDAFAPSAQPELWTEDFFRCLATVLAPGAVLVTYCSKSVVRRAMEAAGFLVKKIPGPYGKREMLRARR